MEGFWRRPVRYYDSERRNFLGSLFCEGGLPFQVLQESGSRFQMLFQKLLKHHDEWKAYGYSTREQVESVISKAHLPQVFSEQTSIELIAAMADELMSLVNVYGLSELENPSGHLDSVNKAWREAFPIPLDDATGTEFLNGLLQTATKETRQKVKLGESWQCAHFFDESSQEFNTTISFPKEIYFQLDEHPPTTRFELFLTSQGKKILDLGAGYATVEDRVAKVRPRLRGVKINNRTIDSRIEVVAAAGGAVVGRLAIENSMVPVGEVPVGFERVDEKWQVCGQASFSTSSADVLIILPENSNFRSDKEVFDCPSVNGLPVKKVQGVAECNIYCEENYVVKTGQDSARSFNVQLVGKLVKWQTKPDLTYLGLPKPNGGSIKEEADNFDKNVYIAGKSILSAPSKELFGAQYLSVRTEDGKSLFRKKIGILPPDFHIEIKHGEVANSGLVRIYPASSYVFQIDSDRVNLKRQKYPDYIELNITCQGVPPSTFDLIITPNLTADPITIRLPFPSSGALLFDCNNEPLPKTFELSRLLGSRVFLLPDSDRVAKYEIELTLLGSVARNARFTWQYRVSKAPLEIDLYSLRGYISNLMSLAPGLDQMVELRIKGQGREDYYRVCRHTQELQLSNMGEEVLELKSEHQNSVPNIEPLAILLSDVERKPVKLECLTTERVATGRFGIPPELHKNGPWLIVPPRNSEMEFRPYLFGGSPPDMTEASELKTMQKAAIVFNPGDEENAFQNVLNAMSLDPFHTGWQYFRTIYDKYSYLPLATFESWKALATNTSALALCLLKFEMDEELLGKLESEFPIVWEFFPIDEHKSATERFKSALQLKGVPKERIETIAKSILARFGNSVHSIDESVQALIMGQPLPPQSVLPLQVMQPIFKSWYQSMLVEQRDSLWPDFGGKKLKAWYKSAGQDILGFEPEMDYRNSVVYLPVFAAAVSRGACELDYLFKNESESIFFLRQVKDFDSTWFSAVYRYCLLNCF
jgi:hypothetical protein